MAVELRHATKVWRRRERGAQFATWAAWFAGAAIFIYCWQLISDKTIWAFVADAPSQAADLAVRMVPPDWGFIHALWRPMWDTINMATLGTLMGIMLALPVAYCAARNTTPSVAFIRPAALFVIVSSRSINSLIWALMLVTIIGPGVLAGILAVGLRSIGFGAKLLYEAIEEIDESQADHHLWHRAASPAGFRRHFGVPLGHQHPRVDSAGPGWRRRHRPAAQRCDHHARLDPGVAHSADHHRNRRRQRMGLSQDPPCHHLRDRELRMIGSDTVDVGGLKSAALRFRVCNSNWRRKTRPAPQGLAVPQRRGSLVGRA
jgi:ABC-type phosphate/phosphonate transport system permease subunit